MRSTDQTVFENNARALLFFDDDARWTEHLERLFTGSFMPALLWLISELIIRIQFRFTRHISNYLLSLNEEAHFFYRFKIRRNPLLLQSMSQLAQKGIKARDIRYLALGKLITRNGTLRARPLARRICVHLGIALIALNTANFIGLFLAVAAGEGTNFEKVIATGCISIVIAIPTYILCTIALRPALAWGNVVLKLNG